MSDHPSAPGDAGKAPEPQAPGALGASEAPAHVEIQADAPSPAVAPAAETSAAADAPPRREAAAASAATAGSGSASAAADAASAAAGASTLGTATAADSPGAVLDLALADLAAMIRFYSRLAVPRLSGRDDPTGAPPFPRAIRMLPWAALVIALPGALVVAILGDGALPQMVVAALAVAMTALVTGAFHEDGFADIADGFGGGATRERRLEIMKDSRIGAFGGVALAAQFVLRTALIAEAIDRFDGPAAALVVLAVAALARVAPLGLMAALPPARPDGLGRAAGTPEPRALGLAAAGTAVIVLVGLAPIAGAASMLAGLALAGVAVVVLGFLARAKIGGFTGDVIGAATIVAEIATMVGVLG